MLASIPVGWSFTSFFLLNQWCYLTVLSSTCRSLLTAMENILLHFYFIRLCVYSYIVFFSLISMINTWIWQERECKWCVYLTRNDWFNGSFWASIGMPVIDEDMVGYSRWTNLVTTMSVGFNVGLLSVWTTSQLVNNYDENY